MKSLCTINRASRMGCNRNGFSGVMSAQFFSGIEWTSAAKQMLVPPIVPYVIGPGDTANYDFYGDEIADTVSNLTVEEREFIMTGYTAEDWDNIF